MIICVLIFLWIFIYQSSAKTEFYSTEIKYEDSFIVYSKEEILEKITLISKDKHQANVQQIENQLKQLAWVENVNAYMNNKALHIKMKFKKPYFKILNTQGNVYYIDEGGNLLPANENVALRLPLGINFFYDKNDSIQKIENLKLVEMSKYIQNDSAMNGLNFYFDFIKKDEIKLVANYPKNVFNIGDMNDYKNKFYKVIFFINYLKKSNIKYSLIDVSFKNQIIGIN